MAFDTVDKDKLCNKLDKFNFSKASIALIHNYMSEMKLYIESNKQKLGYEA